MDIKKKFRSLIGKQETVHSLVEETVSPEMLCGEAAVTKPKVETELDDPIIDQEVIDTIEEVYFHDEAFDTSRYELEKHSSEMPLSKIDEDRSQLRHQLQSVSKKVSELILQNNMAYATELQRVMDLQRTLQLAIIICINSRRQLRRARESFTATSLRLLSNVRRRKKLQDLLHSLHTIKTLQRTDLRLREMMEEEDYSGAIQLCLECQKAASTFRHYQCISELSSKLQDTLEMIEEQLDVALSKTCTKFDINQYEKVQLAYRLLGKTQTAMDQLHMHFTNSVHNAAFTIVLGYVELCSGTFNTNFHKYQYIDLCKRMTSETFTPCLSDLCKALWDVMKSYHKTMQWHEKRELDTTAETDSGSNNVEATFTRRYIRQKLEYGRVRIWQDVQQKVKTFFLSTNLAGFKFDEFLHVLDLINRMIAVGEEFCGSKSEGLQESLKQQSLNYFHSHHRSRLEELKMFLENEGWELCPVRTNFSILQLMEFRFMRGWSASQLTATGDSADSSDQGSNYFQQYEDVGNPFDIQAEEDEQEDLLDGEMDPTIDQTNNGNSDSDSDVPDELKQDFIDELEGDGQTLRPRKRLNSRRRTAHKTAPIITNTTLNVIRVIGRYLQMMTILKPIAFEVINCLSQLFDYYMFTVYMFFGTDLGEVKDTVINNKLKITFQRIRENLLIDEHGVSQNSTSSMDDRRDRVPGAHISPIVDLNRTDTLYGLTERVAAAESLVFMSEQLRFLQPYLASIIPQNKKAFLQQFYSQTVHMASELRKPIYRGVAARSINYVLLQQQMSAVKWDIKDIMSQHSPYVDALLKNFEDFSAKLDGISRRLPLPKIVTDVLWEHCIRQANRTFVDGFASVKKCSNEGRALMQLDFKQFLSKLEKLTDIRPIPERDFVEGYIKAYYLPEAQLETWLQEHKEYNNHQLLSLIGSVDRISKKSRQRLNNIIDDLDRSNTRR